MKSEGRTTPAIEALRQKYHADLFQHCVRFRRTGEPSMCDRGSKASVALSSGMLDRIGLPVLPGEVTPQAAGSIFASVTAQFLEGCFQYLHHLRPGDWKLSTSQGALGIADYSQYRHIADIAKLLLQHPELRTSLGGDYLITPDIIVSRAPIADAEINRYSCVIDPEGSLARRTPSREANMPGGQRILHASISMKWSMRSDRSQNTRTEALNLIRNRKGGTPKIAVVAFEPLPSRLASIALGTGDIDCAYHAALDELMHSAERLDPDGESFETLRMLVEGHRLRDISDLPFDLLI
jgi:hypothetical protein